MTRARLLLIPSIAIAVSHGCGQRPTDAAEDFMAAGMFEQAAALLEQEVLDSPTNAEAHLLLGLTNLSMGYSRSAEGNFQSAVRLDPALGERIGERLLDLAQRTADPGPGTRRLLDTAIRYDPSLRDRVVDLMLTEADSLARVGNLDESQDIVAFAASIEPNAAVAGVDILIGAFKEFGQVSTLSQSRRLVQSVLSLDRSAANPMGEVLMDFAMDARDIGESMRWVEILLEHSLESSVASSLRSFLVDAANRNIASRTEFVDVMDVLESTYPDMPQANTPVENYIYGMHLWFAGNRHGALDFLRRVPGEQRHQLGIEFVDTEVPVGRYPVQRSVAGDFGWGSFTLFVDAVEFRVDRSMLVKLRVTNHTERRQHFVFFGVQGEEKRVRYADASDVRRAFEGADDERFYVLDDFGNRCSSQPPHFVGASNREEFNSSNDAVILEPGQTIEDDIVFPCRFDTKGVTVVSFVSPRHNGHQWKIMIDDIDIRTPTFRPMTPAQDGNRR